MIRQVLITGVVLFGAVCAGAQAAVVKSESAVIAQTKDSATVSAVSDEKVSVVKTEVSSVDKSVTVTATPEKQGQKNTKATFLKNKQSRFLVIALGGAAVLVATVAVIASSGQKNEGGSGAIDTGFEQDLPPGDPAFAP